MDEDAFEALFDMLEEDLKNDDLSVGDVDDDLSEEDLEKLQHELEEALGVGGGDDDEVEMVNSVGDDVEHDDGEDEEEDEEEERPVTLKNWQLRRLARVLKTGRRKASIKSLSAELCLDRAVVLDLLRDPPPNLVMMSAALPDEPAPTLVMPETKPSEILLEEMKNENVVKSESEVKVPVHVMQDNWLARKRLKKIHVDTLERVYRRTKRPTNTMISSIVHVTNLPRKRVVKWFEDKRAEHGVPEQRNPFQRSTAFRRQGSSGTVWEDKSLIKEDRVDYKELRPCQSTRVISTTDSGNSKAAPTAFPRSYSTAPVKQSSKAFGKPLAIPKSKSTRRNLFSNLLFSNK
ncbi:unnamed protein product [Dovyalis caffra]|uniref:Homeobox domain-containing protein n=1 Tax=Dovyalis caffra TaxID=77055 RepID=A0AAV1SPK1_9ROSI|nr:unnamed protein product [Dovyalis caffra]